MTIPSTQSLWANWYSGQWDSYLENSSYAQSHELIIYSGKQLFFRKLNKDSYNRFRTFMQLLDTCLMDIQTLQYNFRDLVAAFMYIILGSGYQQFSNEEIIENFPYSSTYLQKTTYPFNDLFSDFMKSLFACELEHLLPYIQYASMYFALELRFERPRAYNPEENGKKFHFEQFLAYQTYNPYSQKFVTEQRRRDLV